MMGRMRFPLLAAMVLLGAGCALQPAAVGVTVPATRYGCLTETGSRIRLPPGQCLPVHGQVYWQEDIRSTGAADLGEALNRLLPY